MDDPEILKPRETRYHAWIVKNEQFYWASSHEPAGPFGSVLNLIQGVYQAAPKNAHSILRGRIFTEEAENHVAKEVTRVSANKVTFHTPAPSEFYGINVTAHAVQARRAIMTSLPRNLVGQRISDISTFVECRDEICGPPAITKSAHIPRRVIAALILDGEVIWAAKNQNQENKTMHAEVILLQSFLAEHDHIPQAATLWTSLQPCRMCAALIEHSMRGQTYYLEPDEGRFSRNTRLQAVSRERPLTDLFSSSPIRIE